MPSTSLNLTELKEGTRVRLTRTGTIDNPIFAAPTKRDFEPIEGILTDGVIQDWTLTLQYEGGKLVTSQIKSIKDNIIYTRNAIYSIELL